MKNEEVKGGWLKVLMPAVWMLAGAGLTAGGYLLHERHVLNCIVDGSCCEYSYICSHTGAFENGANLEPCTSNLWARAERRLAEAYEAERHWDFIGARRQYTYVCGLYDAMECVCGSLGAYKLKEPEAGEEK